MNTSRRVVRACVVWVQRRKTWDIAACLCQVTKGFVSPEERNHALNTQLSNLVRNRIPTAEVLSEAAAEISFRLPFEECPSFPALFREIDKNLGSFEISRWVVYTIQRRNDSLAPQCCA